jgi:hypothetical protein
MNNEYNKTITVPKLIPYSKPYGQASKPSPTHSSSSSKHITRIGSATNVSKIEQAAQVFSNPTTVLIQTQAYQTYNQAFGIGFEQHTVMANTQAYHIYE